MNVNFILSNMFSITFVPQRGTKYKIVSKYIQKLPYFAYLFQGDKTQFTEKQFTEFLLVVENSPLRSSEDGDVAINPLGSSFLGRTGSFQLLGDVLTRFSDHCTNTVTQTSSVAKSEIQVLWTAPPAGSGCVTFKATVVENR